MRPLAVVAISASFLGGFGLSGEPASGAPQAPRSPASRDATPAPARSDSRTLVVLELFTSQGCSSCPPADRVLSRLGLDENTRAKVIPLAFHVDYWNRIGWTDPFSSAEWSARQETYNRALRTDGPYTPQIVIGGRTQLNGAYEERVRAEIVAQLEAKAAAVLDLAITKPATTKPSIDVAVTAEITGNVHAAKLQVLVALFEGGLVTPVERGENGGRTLRNDFVVRRLAKAFSLAPEAGARGRKSVNLELDPAWKTSNLGVAALLQDPGSMRIYGAATGAVQP